MLKSKFSNLSHPLKICSILVTLLVLKFFKSNEVSALQKRNILFIFSTEEVSKPLTFKALKALHPLKVFSMEVTFEVLKLVKSIDSKPLQLRNISEISVISELSNSDKSINLIFLTSWNNDLQEFIAVSHIIVILFSPWSKFISLE